MPKLWNDTIDEHRRSVREAIMDATAAMASERGPTSVTMSAVAESTGIGRATLYKYFPDVEAILIAWHERQVCAHLRELVAVRDRTVATQKLRAVLEAYAVISRAGHGSELAVLVHRGEHLTHARHQLRDLIEALLVEGVARGDVRADVPAAELATFCLHALGAAGNLPSKAAVHRLVGVTLEGLRPPAGQD